MILIDNLGNTNPYLNLALEEYMLRNSKQGEDFILFYINEPSIIIGRNQNTLEEINTSYIEEKGIHVVRRISGGGAVYHDHGNLNFSFITDYDVKRLNNFKNFTQPIVNILNEMGVPAKMEGRNDLLAKGKKISGNAQFSSVKRMFSHGTLLFDTNLNEVAKALQVKMSKIQSKGHKSVRSRVTNITEFLPEPMRIEDFKQKIIDGLFKEKEDFSIYQLTDEEWAGVHQLKKEKYDQWDWNYGKSPKFNIRREKKFPVGIIDLRIYVEKGHIAAIKIYGDFFSKDPVDELEYKLLNVRYTLPDIKEALSEVNLKNYFGDLAKDDFIELLYGEDEE